MKLVKAYNGDGSYSVLFEDEQGNLSYESDGGYGIVRDSVIKTEPLEQGDTLQEVVNWCKENEQGVCIGSSENIYIGEFTTSPLDHEFNVPTQLLKHIRTPKLDKITLEEANEILKEQGKIIEL